MCVNKCFEGMGYGEAGSCLYHRDGAARGINELFISPIREQ